MQQLSPARPASGPSRRSHWPLWWWLYAAMLGRLDRWFGIRVLYVFRRPLAAEQDVSADLEPDYVFKVMAEEELLRHADNPDLHLHDDSIREALKCGDVCFGILYRGYLIAYRWYSLSSSTPCEGGLFIRYAYPGRAYGYKEFTHPDHRGKRLHQHTMKHSDGHLMNRGYTHTIGYIHTHNFASLRNNARMRGVQTIGFIFTMKLFGRHLIINSPGASRNTVSLAAEP